MALDDAAVHGALAGHRWRTEPGRACCAGRLVLTTPRYEPRCGCCPLLRSPEVDEQEYGRAHGPYPEVQRVRLDVQTGVCVLADDPEALGTGHDLRIEAVDEPMDDDLFVQPRRWPFRR